MAGVVDLPEKALKKLNTHILPQWKICFFAAIIFGLLAHLYKITSWLPNWDSLVFRYDPQNMLPLGRWFLPVVCSFTSFYDLPFLNGIVAILFHALGAVCICRMFNVQKKITAGLIGAVIVSFPTVTSVMMYNYVADGYSIAFFLSVLAAFYMTGEKPRVILPALLLALACGIYQAYVTVAIMLVLLHLINEVVFNSASVKAIFRKGVFALIAGILGVVLYSVVLKILLAVFSIELLDYQGANVTASMAGIDLAASLYVIKETFIKCFFDLSNGLNVYVALNFFVLIFTLAFYLKCIVKNKIYKKPASIIVIILLGAMLIFGASALAFANPAVDYHNLMLMGYSVFYLFFVLIYEKIEEKHTAITAWIVLILGLAIILNQIVISNVSYHKAQMAYEKSYGVLIRIADRIEQTESAESCSKILVIGALENSDAYCVNLTPHITGITDGYIIRADDETVGQSVLCAALNDYCGKDYDFLSGEEKQKIAQREDIKALEKWPAKNCVAIVDDTVVIKLGAEGEN